jgi:probable phosphoglycerate mutase
VLSLYLLRHGETAFSRQDRFCGQIDVPLTEDGRRMAEAFGAAYGELPWRAIVTSMRARAYETALPVAMRAGLPIKRDPRLDEMFFGRWQGLSKQEIAGCDAERYALWSRNPAVGPPGGELPTAVAARAEAAIAELREAPGEGNVLVVSHKAVIRILLCRLLGIELGRYRELCQCPVAGLSVVELESGEVSCRSVDDVRHLPSHLQPTHDAAADSNDEAAADALGAAV